VPIVELGTIVLKESPPTTLNLFSDSCSAKQKPVHHDNIAILHKPQNKNIKQINHIFPVRA